MKLLEFTFILVEKQPIILIYTLSKYACCSVAVSYTHLDVYKRQKLVFIPQENVRDLAEIPQKVKDGLEIKAVKSIDEILPLAFVEQPTPLVKAPIVKAVDEGKKAARH